jgi:hypothetical protein
MWILCARERERWTHWSERTMDKYQQRRKKT